MHARYGNKGWLPPQNPARRVPQHRL